MVNVCVYSPARAHSSSTVRARSFGSFLRTAVLLHTRLDVRILAGPLGSRLTPLGGIGAPFASCAADGPAARSSVTARSTPRNVVRRHSGPIGRFAGPDRRPAFEERDHALAGVVVLHEVVMRRPSPAAPPRRRVRFHESHSNCLLCATDRGAVLIAMSRELERAGSTSSLGSTRLHTPRSFASLPSKVRPDEQDLGRARHARDAGQRPVRVAVAHHASRGPARFRTWRRRR